MKTIDDRNYEEIADLRAQLAAETKRADEAEERASNIKATLEEEYVLGEADRQTIADLRTEKAAAEQARDAAERENARLREGIKRVACDWDRKSSDVYGLVAGEDGKAIRAVVDGFSALLAQPEEVKDGK